VSVLRDTGCSTVVVRRSLVSEDLLTGEKATCVLIDGTVRRTPVANIDIRTPYFSGTVRALGMERPLYDIIIGSVEGVKDAEDEDAVQLSDDVETQQDQVVFEEGQAVVTRSQSKPKVTKPLSVAEATDTTISIESIAKLQAEDASLKKICEKLQQKTGSADSKETEFFMDKTLLYRHDPKEQQRGTSRSEAKQLVLPETLRLHVMKVAHESIMSGHQAIARTFDRVSAQFWWPGITGDVHRFCKSCEICQRTVAKGKTSKVPLGNVPLIDTPFKRVSVDLVGPIFPATDCANRYLLTLVDYASRYPEAVALKNVETETVAEALVSIFARVGIPTEVLSDQGRQFMSGVMKEVSRLLFFRQLTTTPYHPQCNGLVERFNSTLKTMLKRMCSERPKDWDRYVDALFFAYREVPQESTGFSPFETLYGHSVRGPMTILKQLWTKKQENLMLNPLTSS